MFGLKFLKIVFSVKICYYYVFHIVCMLSQHQFNFIIALWFRHLYFHGFHSVYNFCLNCFILFFPVFINWWHITGFFFVFLAFIVIINSILKSSLWIELQTFITSIKIQFHRKNNREWVATLSQMCIQSYALWTYFSYTDNIYGKGGIWKWKWRPE